MSRALRITVISACLVLIACQASVPRTAGDEVSAANRVREQAKSGFGPDISAEDFAAHIKVLASDEFAGRAPGTIGETKTVEYLIQQAMRLGLQPGNGDSFVQEVPMAAVTSTTTPMRVVRNGGVREFAFASQMVVASRLERADVALKDSELVFVGYGVNAPEQGWNDYAGLDVKGKTVVMLVNDPGFHANDASLFEGRRMTYYGRWTYKYEEAARQGAAAAIIIHDTEGAGYGWDVIKNSWSGEQYDLPQSVDKEARVPMQGWWTAETAQQVFADAGLDFSAMRQAANRRGFKPVSLKAKLDVAVQNRIRYAKSNNVIAKLPGRSRPDEAVFYTAHWDHLGVHADESGDNIYNGAIDNATGVAGLLEIAENFVTQSPPERSVVFLWVTLEESGLLGSKYYAANPTMPLRDIAAVINIDALTPVGPTRDLMVVGLGNSELDEILRPIAKAQNRELQPESAPERGIFFRSDHFSFAKAGVPALYIKGGMDHVEHGKAHGQAILDDYTKEHYHRGADNYDPTWDLRGTVMDLRALYQVGSRLAKSEQWPNYVEGNAFRAVREQSRKSSP